MSSHQHLPAAVQVTHRVARTFSLAIRFLPSALREDIYLLYLVCRTLDDLADTAAPEAEGTIALVRRWAAGGRATGREAEILNYLFSRYPSMPRDAVIDFCDGQVRALGPIHIETEDDLDHYAYQVAGTVGRLMVGILGARDARADGASRALGIAMQRTNILRDLDEDLAHGNVFIPRAALQELGIRDLCRDDRSELLRAQIAIADARYEEGLAGIHLLRCGVWQVRAAALMYREILRQIETDGLGHRRPHRSIVPPSRKGRVMVRVFLQSRTPHSTPGRRSSLEGRVQ